MRSIGVGLLGCGTVGTAVVQILQEYADPIAERAGARVELRRVVVRDKDRTRSVQLPQEMWTTDPGDVIGASDVDVVVDAVGGVEQMLPLLLAAVGGGQHVVTANKELLASVGHELLDAADRAGVDVLFEAAVGGGIPIIRPVKESLAGDRVRRVIGILNGTTNFILTRMSETGTDFTEALAEAQDHGYAEADPTADVDGFDAASKLAILASLAFGARVVAADVSPEGIRSVGAEDISAAHELGYEVKLLAIAERIEGEVSVRVHPAMLPLSHPLAAVRDVFNAVFVEGERSGPLMFYGRGAGGAPTASAVVGDIVEIARNIGAGARSIGSTYHRAPASIRRADLSPARFYVVLSVLDQPGVLAEVASVFARHDVSIASVRQEGFGAEARLTLITHTASEGAHRATFDELRESDCVKSIRSTMRVEDAE